jgi:hypothetical protein
VFRRFDLRVDRFPWAPTVALAVAAYANLSPTTTCRTCVVPLPSASSRCCGAAGSSGARALLVRLSFVLVAAVKMQEGRFYGEVGAVPAVSGDTSSS